MTTGTDLVAYKAQLKAQAAAAVAEEQLQGSTVMSTRGGTLTYGEETLPGNQACVIIVDSYRENTYYTGKFDSDNPSPPTCYAFGRGPQAEDEMAPHESMQVDEEAFIPQAAECRLCPWNEWGSADKGRGKACQNRRRLMMIPAGFYTPKRGSRDFDLDLFTDPNDFLKSDFAQLKLPVTSVKGYAKFVNQVSAQFQLPPHGVIIRLFLEPDANSQYTVNFEVIDVVPDDVLVAVMQRHDEAVAMKFQGYQPPREQPPAHTENPRGSLRNMRR